MRLRGIGASASLFFLAPLLAEYLLGDLPLSNIGALIALAPMYGGGAILIRETVRRSGRGWGTKMPWARPSVRVARIFSMPCSAAARGFDTWPALAVDARLPRLSPA